MIMNLFANPYRGATSANAEAHEQDFLARYYAIMTDASLENEITTAQRNGEFDCQNLRYALAEKEKRVHATVPA